MFEGFDPDAKRVRSVEEAVSELHGVRKRLEELQREADALEAEVVEKVGAPSEGTKIVDYGPFALAIERRKSSRSDSHRLKDIFGDTPPDYVEVKYAISTTTLKSLPEDEVKKVLPAFTTSISKPIVTIKENQS